jgi:ferredoxin--NADP+ reductase
VVLLGARHSWDLGYRGELIAMQRYCPTFHYIPVISRPDEELVPWSGQTGYVQDLWDRGLVEQALHKKPTPENTHILLCGNPAMIEAMISRLGEEGFREHTKSQPGQIHAEKYW